MLQSNLQTNLLLISGNGEIYNHNELRSQLRKKGHRFKSRCDTEVIAHLYEELGTECLKYLEGMFALGILDTVQKRLLVARDRAGMKPLYIYRSGSGFAFASEIKALFAAGLVAPIPDPRAIDIYLSLGYVPAPLSSFQGIEKLRPGNYLMVDKNGPRESSFCYKNYTGLQQQ